MQALINPLETLKLKLGEKQFLIFFLQIGQKSVNAQISYKLKELEYCHNK
jgi:hypothetical protein